MLRNMEYAYIIVVCDMLVIWREDRNRRKKN